MLWYRLSRSFVNCLNVDSCERSVIQCTPPLKIIREVIIVQILILRRRKEAALLDACNFSAEEEVHEKFNLRFNVDCD